MSLDPNGAPPGYYYQPGATSYLLDPAGTYSAGGATAPTLDPVGTYSGPGASAPTLADPGTYIPVTGATSETVETIDPLGTYSAAGASAPALADPGTYIAVTGATSEAVETADPAGTYSGAGASAPTLAAAGTYIPVAGATSSAAEIVAPAGTYAPAGASAPIADPGGTFSAAGATAPSIDPAGTYSSPYALTRLFVEGSNSVPDNIVLSFNSATAVANYFGAPSEEATLANEFFAGYGAASATMLFTRFPLNRRAHLLGVNISNLTLSQLQGISGSLAIIFQGWTYYGSINLSGVKGFAAAAAAIQTTLDSNLPVAAVTAGNTIAPVSVSFTASLARAFLQVTSVSSGIIELGAQISGPGVTPGSQIVTQLSGTPGGVGLYSLYVTGGNVSSETMTESYGVLTVGAVTSGTVGLGEQVTGAGVASLTAIDDNLSGSGPGSTWIVNNAQAVAAENMTLTATPLEVVADGATGTNDFFDVSSNHEFGYNNNPSSLSYMSGTAAAALGLTQASGANDSSPGGEIVSPQQFMNDLVQNEDGQFGSYENIIAELAMEDPAYLQGLDAWNQSAEGFPYSFLSADTSTTPAGSSAPTIDPAGTYSSADASAPTLDPAGTYSLAGESAPTIDPAGTYSFAGASALTIDPAGAYSGADASAPTLAAPGTYIAVLGATSAAAEVVDPAGTYSFAGASAPTIDPAGAYTGAEASAPTLAAPGTYIAVLGATSAAAELIDPAGTYSGAGASAPTIDPAGTFSGSGASAPTPDPAGAYTSAGASAPMLAAPGTYMPGAGATSAAAEIVDPAGTYSAAGASLPTIDPAGAYSGAGASAPLLADPGSYIPYAGATAEGAEIVDPAGTYSAAGASAPAIDPAGTYSAAGASAPTIDPAGAYSGAGASAPLLADPGSYIPFSGATAEGAETIDPAGTYSAAGASAPTTDPAGTYSAAGASAPTIDPAGTYSGAGASAPTIDAPGSYSLAGASAPTLAQPGYYVPTAGASSATPDDTGYYTPYSGATAEILALPPAISGTVGGQSAASGEPVTPFASAVFADPNIDVSDSLSIQFAGAAGTLVDGAGFNGLTSSAPGVYLLSGAAAQITSELEALVFIPGPGAATATFTLTGASTAGTSASDDNTTLTLLSDGGGTGPFSAAYFIANQASLDGTLGGFDIADTAADISASLDQLNDPNIDAITIADNGQVGASIQQLTTDATAIGKLLYQNGAPGQLAISDIAANITAALNGLNGANIASITISDSGAIGVSVAELTSDGAAIGKLANAGASPYQLAVSDIAANITAALNGLNGANIASITISDSGAIGVSVAELTSDAAAIGKLANASASPYQLAVSDTAADITTGLNSLDGANIASIMISDSGAVGVSVAELAGDGAAIGKLANASASPYQLAVSDIAANITTGLNSLDGANIASIMISDSGAVGVTVAELASDAAAIGKLANASTSPYQLAVSDIAANITAALNSLNGASIASITISDSMAIGVSVAELTSDGAAIGKLANAGASPYQLAVSDIAANITAALNTLDGANIASITISDNGAVGVSVAQLTSDAAAIGKLANASASPYQLAVSDTAADITAALNSLNGANIASIMISDSGAIGVSVAQLNSDGAAIGKLANANASPYQLAVSDTALNIQGALATLEADIAHVGSIAATGGPIVVTASTFAADQAVLDRIAGGFDVSDTAANIVAELLALSGDSHVAQITAASGSATLGAGAIVDASSFAETGSGTSLTLAEVLNYAGAFSQGAGSKLSISSGETLSLTGAANLSGTISGPGTLALGGSSDSINAGAVISVANLSISGSGASVRLGEALTYAGAFSEGAGATLALTGGALVLTGPHDAFSGGTVDGSNLLYTEGTTAVSGLTIGGTVEWENTHIVNENGGWVTIGDASGAEAILYNAAKATYDILDNSGIGLGASTASYISDAGLFEKTGGAGTSVIAPSFSETSTGTVTVASGTLSFSGAVNSFAGAITGAGTLQLAGGSDSINSGAISVANWSISGPVAVTLGKTVNYAGAFSEGVGATLALTGGSLVLTGAHAAFSSATVDGSRFLYTEGTTSVSGLTIGGTVQWKNTNAVNESGGSATIGDANGGEAILDNMSNATYDILDDSGIGIGSSTASYIENAGVLEKTGGTGASAIALAVVNTGTLEVTSGTLDFLGAVTGTGKDTISGASTLEFDAAVSSSKTLGSQNIGFAGAGALDLTDPKAFWGEISGFAASDAVTLLGSWAISSFSENAGGTLATLTLASGASKHAFDFVGNFTQGEFKITSGATSTVAYV